MITDMPAEPPQTLFPPVKGQRTTTEPFHENAIAGNHVVTSKPTGKAHPDDVDGHSYGGATSSPKMGEGPRGPIAGDSPTGDAGPSYGTRDSGGPRGPNDGGGKVIISMGSESRDIIGGDDKMQNVSNPGRLIALRFFSLKPISLLKNDRLNASRKPSARPLSLICNRNSFLWKRSKCIAILI